MFFKQSNLWSQMRMLRTCSFYIPRQRLCQWMISVTSHPSLMPLSGVGCQRHLTHKVNEFPKYFCSFLIDAPSSQVIYFSSAESVSLPLLVLLASSFGMGCCPSPLNFQTRHLTSYVNGVLINKLTPECVKCRLQPAYYN